MFITKPAEIICLLSTQLDSCYCLNEFIKQLVVNDFAKRMCMRTI